MNVDTLPQHHALQLFDGASAEAKYKLQYRTRLTLRNLENSSFWLVRLYLFQEMAATPPQRYALLCQPKPGIKPQLQVAMIFCTSYDAGEYSCESEPFTQRWMRFVPC